MEIAVLCVFSLLLACGVYGAVRYYCKQDDTELEGQVEAEVSEDEAEAIDTAEAISGTETHISKKACVLFAVFSTVVLIALVAEGRLMFPSHSIILNIKNLILIAFLLAVSLIDYKRRIVPNRLVLIMLMVRMVLYIVQFFALDLKSDFWPLLVNDLIALLIPLFMLIAGILVIKNGIGMGDIKLLIVIALYQGIRGAISTLIFGLLAAFIIAIGLLIIKKKKRHDTIPFAPSVFFGAVVTMVLTGI